MNYIYNFGESPEIFYSPGNNKYPRVIYLAGYGANMVKTLSDFDFLDLLYPDEKLTDLGAFPDLIKRKIGEFSQGEKIFLKFYTLSPEFQTIRQCGTAVNMEFQAFHLISIGHLSGTFSLDVGMKPKQKPHLVQRAHHPRVLPCESMAVNPSPAAQTHLAPRHWA